LVKKIIITDKNKTRFVIANNSISEKDMREGVNSPSVISKALSLIGCQDSPDLYKSYLGAKDTIMYVKYKGKE
jgi:hypothetical protein